MTWLFHLLGAMGQVVILVRPWRTRTASVLALLFVAQALAAVALGEDGFGRARLLGHAVFIQWPIAALIQAALLGRRRRYAIAAVLGLSAFAVVAAGAYAYFVEPQRLGLTRYELTSSRLQRRIRVALVADLQTDQIGDYERRALALVAQARPDLVLFAGDYIQEPSLERRVRLLAELRALLASVDLRPALGSFAVQGNIDGPQWATAFEGLPIQATTTTRDDAIGPDLQLTRLSLDDSFDPALRIGPRRDRRLRILVGHAPDYALSTHLDADLLLAGHTHGGQVRLPLVGPLLTLSRVPRAWAAGRTRVREGVTLIVSRGIGHERGHAPRLRFNCPPEIVIIDLIPSAARRDGQR